MLKVKHSEVKDIISRLFPTYKGRKDVYIIAAEHIELTGTYWDGGSRDTYAAFEPFSKKHITLPRFDPPQFGGPIHPPDVPLCDGEGHYIVIAKFTQGLNYITFYVHPDNMAKLLPSAS